jgi:O-antigen/teichoic acid export membrane protein
MKCAEVVGIGGAIDLQIFHKKNFPIAREAFWTALGQVLTLLGSLVLIRIVTSYLTSAEYGYLTLGLTVTTFYSQVIMGGVNASIGRYYSIYLARNDLTTYLKVAVDLVKSASFLALILTLVLVLFLYINGYGSWNILIVGTGIFALFTGVNSAIISILTSARLRFILAINAGVELGLKAFFVLVVIFTFGPSAESVIFGFCFSALFFLLILRYFLNNLIYSEKVSIKFFKNPCQGAEMWSFVWPLLIMGIAAWGQSASSRWILKIYSTVSDVGIFQILAQIAAPIQVLSSVLIVFIAPIYFSLSGDGENNLNKHLIRLTTLRIAIVGLGLVAIMFAATYFFHQEIFSLLVDENFSVDSNELPWMIASCGILGVSQIFCTQLFSELRIKEVMYAGIFSGAIGIILNLFFGSKYGLVGIVFSQCIYALINFLWLLALTMRELPSVNKGV